MYNLMVYIDFEIWSENGLDTVSSNMYLIDVDYYHYLPTAVSCDSLLGAV